MCVCLSVVVVFLFSFCLCFDFNLTLSSPLSHILQYMWLFSVHFGVCAKIIYFFCIHLMMTVGVL